MSEQTVTIGKRQFRIGAFYRPCYGTRSAPARQFIGTAEARGRPGLRALYRFRGDWKVWDISPQAWRNWAGEELPDD